MSRLAVIGAGNMGAAILAGAVRAGVMTPHEAVVTDVDSAKCVAMERQGFAAAGSAREAVERLGEDGQVLLAVKPQMLAGFGSEIADVLGGSDRVVISILAGVPSGAVRAALGGSVRVVRAMPNLPSAVGEGATAVCLGAGARAGDEGFALALFRGIGPVVAAIAEDLMDAYTGVAGSGPAYVFLLAEAMIAGAKGVGLDEATAREAVVQTIVGAAAMLKTDGRAPGDLRAAVTSRGGTTQAALEELARAGVVEAWVRAIAAARDRGRELGRMAGG